MMITIPKQLQNDEFRFVRIQKGLKAPTDHDWPRTGNFTYNDPTLLRHLENGGNYGVVCGYGNLLVIDCDKPYISEIVEKQMPRTFTVKSKKGFHFYFFCKDLTKPIRMTSETAGDLGDIQVTGKQVVGPGSQHPDGPFYQVYYDVPIKEITALEIKSALSEYVGKEFEKLAHEEKQHLRNHYNNDIDIPISEIVSPTTLPIQRGPNEYQGEHPKHGSDNGHNFCINTSKNCWKCFRHDTGGGAVSLIAVIEGIIDCSDARPGGLRGEKFRKTIEVINKKYGYNIKTATPTQSSASSSGAGKKSAEDDDAGVLEDMELLLEENPMFCDEANIWQVWDADGRRWKAVNDTYIDALIHKFGRTDVIRPHRSNKYHRTLRMIALEYKPKPVPQGYIQFKNCVVDISSGAPHVLTATSEYHYTNPIPHNFLNVEQAECPTIDKLFHDWVGDRKNILYQIAAYSMLPSLPLHRLFALVGPGRNGKGRYTHLLMNLIGIENVTSSTLERLDPKNSRFELARLYKKLAVFIGETGYAVLKDNSTLKMLAGDDLITGEVKNKGSYDFFNVAKMIISTNCLPPTGEKTDGFYSKWIVVEFPNQFKEGKDPLKDIPEREYDYFATKCVYGLIDLLKKGEFEGYETIEKKREIYEELSNPVQQYIHAEYVRDPDGKIWLWEFAEEVNHYSVKKGARPLDKSEVKKMLEHLGYVCGKEKYQKENGERTERVAVYGLRNRQERQPTIKEAIANQGPTLAEQFAEVFGDPQTMTDLDYYVALGRLMKPGKVYHHSTILEIAKKAGYSAELIDNAFIRLSRDGEIVAYTSGEWRRT